MPSGAWAEVFSPQLLILKPLFLWLVVRQDAFDLVFSHFYINVLIVKQ